MYRDKQDKTKDKIQTNKIKTDRLSMLKQDIILRSKTFNKTYRFDYERLVIV